MTVTYTAEVATCRGFGCFLKLLIRWRGSIYKLVWPDLATFLFMYYTLNLSYRLALDKEQKSVFEAVVRYCEAYSDLIPLSFVLGFYISIIMQRWWDQYSSIPWPDPIAVFVSSHIHGQDERGRLMRRTIMRYVCLCLTMVFSMVSPRVKMRFPTLEHFVEAGLLLENEKSIISDLDEKFPRHSKHWLPIVWAASIVTRARREGRIRDDYASKTIIDELNKFRGQCGLLLNYDSISVPLVYTQVVTLAVYSYFLTSVIARQWLEVNPDVAEVTSRHRSKIDLYFPFFLTLQFFFYMGWLKVAESLINPFGEDDDDFEVNWIIDRNVQVSYLIVDEMHHEHPELIKDQYWDEVLPAELPYTVASEPFREEHPQASTANIDVPAAGTTLSFNSTLKLDEMAMADHMVQDDAASGIHFMAKSAGSRPQSHYYDRTLSTSSNTSINTNVGVGSMAGSLHRVASVTSVLKRLFSREPPQPPAPIPMSSVEAGGMPGMPHSGSTAVGTTETSNFKRSTSGSSINIVPKAPGGSVRLTDQVIEEVDEQTTITSMRRPDPRPNVRDIFAKDESLVKEDKGEANEALKGTGAPPASAPMSVPHSSHGAHSQELHQPMLPLSSSAPSRGHISVASPSRFSDNFPEVLSIQSAPGYSPPHSQLGSVESLAPAPLVDAEETISIGASSSESGDDNEMDEFTRLKRARQREQRQRQLARSISQHQATIVAVARRRESGAESISESENLLLDLTDNSRTGLLSSSPQDMSHPH